MQSETVVTTTTTRRVPKVEQCCFSHRILEKEYNLLVFINVTAMILAFYSIHQSMDSSIPWIATMTSCSWAAWGASKVAYNHKSTKENTQGGIIYETAVKDVAD